MIKVNLLPQRKSKRVAEPGQSQVVAGIGVLLFAAAAVFFLVHKPLADQRKAFDAEADELESANDVAAGKLADYETLKKVVAEQKARAESIAQLEGARAVPANVLHELSEILRLGQMPKMTHEMERLTSGGPGSDSNKYIAPDWDPKHVWITSFVEEKGDFVLEGGAQSDGDVTQLAKRMQASVYFLNVTPQGGERVVDPTSGVNYFKFTITGKVVY